MLEHELRLLAGDGAYERGLEYFHAGRVEEVATHGAKTTARVHGTRTYAVTLLRTTRGFDGACDCPASDGFDFCKHCVAVALTVAAQDAERATLESGSAEDQIRAYLLSQDKQSLADALLEATEMLPELKQKLSFRADAAQGRVNFKTLKKQITAASPMRDIWHRGEAQRYFWRFAAVLSSIVEIADRLPAKDLLKLITHTEGRLNKALERVDDSDGNRWSVQHELHKLHIKALSETEWTVHEQASHLLDCVLRDPYDLYAGFDTTYDEHLGESGWLVFYAQARTRLEELPRLEMGESYEVAAPYRRLQQLLEAWHEKRGETEEIIAVKLLACITARDCHDIAALYLARSALAECGEWLSKGDQNLREQADANQRSAPIPTSLHVAYHEAVGSFQRAMEIQYVLFCDRPSYSKLQRLLHLADLASQHDQTENAAIAFLNEELSGHKFAAETAALVLAQHAREQGHLDRAFDLITDYVHSEHPLLELVDWFADQPERACTIIQRAIEDCISVKKKQAYKRAAQLLEQEAKPRFEQVDSDAFDLYVAELRVTHKAKRSLISILDAKGLSGKV